MNGDPTYDELLAANKELRSRLARLEDNSQVHQAMGMKIKSRFLSNVTHEIRTPMNAIMGFTGLLQRDGISENERDEYLFYINHNSQALLQVMDNIIDLTLLETENLMLSRESVDIRDLIERVYETHNTEMTKTQGDRVAILMSIPDNDSRNMVNADGRRLRRVMDNLVSCVLRYQKRGVVELKLEVPENGYLAFSINCEGNAQLEDRANKIFENTGSEDDWHGQMDNTGVTCKLARDLVTAMGGDITLNSSSIGNRLEIKIRLSVLNGKKQITGAGLGLDVDEIPA